MDRGRGVMALFSLARGALPGPDRHGGTCIALAIRGMDLTHAQTLRRQGR